MSVTIKNPLANKGDIRDMGFIPGSRRSPEEGGQTHSSILVWRIMWTEVPGRVQSIGLQNQTELKQPSTEAHRFL